MSAILETQAHPHAGHKIVLKTSEFASLSTFQGSASYSRCCLPKDPGFCKAYFLRFFYNANSQRCEQFVYGGCPGNRNNFVKRKECSDVCRDAEC